MENQIEALERLARMRADGHITELEFQSEKAKVLGVLSEHKYADLKPNWFRRALIGSGIGLVAVGTIGFATWNDLRPGAAMAEFVDAAALGAAGDLLSPAWLSNDQVDPMTDERVRTATRSIAANGFVVDVEIICRMPTGAVNYVFTAFDGNRAPAEAVSAYYNAHLGYYHTALVRMDGGEAQPIRTFSPDYSNQFLFDQSTDARLIGGILGNSRDQLMNGRILTVKLDLKQGAPVVEIDQSDAAIAKVLEPCRAAEQDRAKQESDTKEQRISEIEAEYRSLASIPEERRTVEQVRNMIHKSGRLRELRGTGKAWPATDAERAELARAEQREIDRNAAGSQNQPATIRGREIELRGAATDDASAAAHWEREERRIAEVKARQAAEQKALCSSVRSTGAGNADYERMQGC